MKSFALFLMTILILSACGKKGPTTTVIPPLPGDTTANTYGGSADDGFVSTIVLPDGGAISAGYTSSNNGQVSGAHGDYDYWVVRTDNKGTIVWQKAYGGSASDKPAQMIATTDGNYAIIGNSLSADGDRQNVNGNLWIIKIDGLGNLIWQKSYGVYTATSGVAIDNTADGGLVFVSNEDNGAGFNDLTVFKTDAQGTINFQATEGGTESHVVYGMKVVANGYIITGLSEDTIGQRSPGHGSGDLMIMKMGFSGNIFWKHMYGGTDADTAFSIVRTPDDGFLLTGSTVSHDGDIKKSQGGEDIVVCKVDTGGILQWIKTYGGAGADQGHFITPTADGNYLITANTSSISGDVTQNHGMNEIWILKIDGSGSVLFARSCGGTKNETAGQAFETSTGHFLVTGSTSSTDGDVVGTHGAQDAWILTF